MPQRFVQKTSGSPHEVLRLELLGTMLFLLQRRGEAWCGWRKQVAFRSSANSRAWARNDDDEEPDGGHGLGGPGVADPAEDGGWRIIVVRVGVGAGVVVGDGGRSGKRGGREGQ